MAANMSLKKNEMPVQDPVVRSANFKEVALGYTKEQAVDEANRCLNCKNKPCVSECPVNIDIPAFIAKVKDGDFEGGYQEISKYSSLPAVCGRVCPQETQCEGKCVRGVKGESVGIGRIERFVADYHNENSKVKAQKPVSNGHRVAVVGSGPAGLSCAGSLAKLGFDVSIFEALHKAGGVLDAARRSPVTSRCPSLCVKRFDEPCEVLPAGEFLILSIVNSAGVDWGPAGEFPGSWAF
jgi:glutamate synthase (NADPH/NADH) small chain